jgi:8-oxo-dGTP diphosphatase
MSVAAFHDCVGALLVRDGEVLLGRRAADCAWLPGAWDMFGGHIEAGESVEAALRRELGEELGIDPFEVRRLGTIGGDHPEPWRLHVHVVTSWRGDPQNLQLHEHAEIRWCSPDEAKQRLGPAHADLPSLIERALATTRPGTGLG